MFGCAQVHMFEVNQEPVRGSKSTKQRGLRSTRSSQRKTNMFLIRRLRELATGKLPRQQVKTQQESLLVFCSWRYFKPLNPSLEVHEAASLKWFKL